MPEVKLIETEDGSHSLFVPSLNETYHSFHGAVNESKHVFIKEGLDELINKFGVTQVNILEIGFGTGLNALLTKLWANENLSIQINYTTLEPFPLDANITRQLNYGEKLGGETAQNEFLNMHEAEWDQEVSLSENFSLHKMEAKIQDAEFNDKLFNLIYFDAFAPSKQAEMWDLEVLGKVRKNMSMPGILTTYCAKGQLKRDLRSLGFEVESIPGPPGKKEMVRGLLT
ncbi:tRNA (5-methylaminomethyl-2-thiouridine)(34)-methyltransferase MnmD [Aureibacter tunicatorum]|uniref:tRNA U34 5-methylaminomethyl-2-thiouridine-forming methyltransferase MnmC n=1 Tax=Aureibacter tunicatorum TaxID=866807 RepID=A0AAE4BRH2_9BACT|nr:tRNA (5-methylaminomethyl-2-thiouridine)(34)-methyltransferase MnmD [Aureibacter tunicatorum]MDR6238661.1 tRNA U34 5-methylaminomethyl-2-thiouridine-forming methyltransferase MnmC [Aureibacter tunicatorum]BDD05408.1 hypothetical protein AUTU_28910 [Aureibacter tunicatorum]